MKRILCALCISLIGWQALAGEGDDAYKHATEAVKTAKTAADLDAVIEELKSVVRKQEALKESSTQSEADIEKPGEACAFVEKWQEYLAAKAGGYDDEARSIAKDLTAWSTILLPRSVILAKAYEPKIAGDKQAQAVQNIVEEAVKPSPLIINLGQDGRMRIGKDAPMDTEKMVWLIKENRATNPNFAVIIRVHKSHQRLTDVMQALEMAEVRNFAFTIDSAPDATPAPQPTPAK